MSKKYPLTVKEGKDKNFETIDFVGTGFENKNGYVNLNINITKLFKIAKDRPDLLKEYNGDKQIWVSTNINVGQKSSNTQDTDNSRGGSFTHDDLNDEIPFSPYMGV